MDDGDQTTNRSGSGSVDSRPPRPRSASLAFISADANGCSEGFCHETSRSKVSEEKGEQQSRSRTTSSKQIGYDLTLLEQGNQQPNNNAFCPRIRRMHVRNMHLPST